MTAEQAAKIFYEAMRQSSRDGMEPWEQLHRGAQDRMIEAMTGVIFGLNEGTQ